MLWGYGVVVGVSGVLTLPRGVLPASGVVYAASYLPTTRHLHKIGQEDCVGEQGQKQVSQASGGEGREGEDMFERRTMSCEIKGLRARTIIGLHPHERRTKQWVEVDLTVRGYDEREWKHADFAEEVYGVSRNPSSDPSENLSRTQRVPYYASSALCLCIGP